MSNPDSGSAFPATQTHPNPIYAGDCTGVCSLEDFLAHMPETESKACPEVTRKKKRREWRVFWYPSTYKPDPNRTIRELMASVDDVKARAVPGNIKSLLGSLDYCQSANSMFIQFWAPTQSSSGQNMLTVLEQPFGMGTLLNGFCRYRYGCMKKAIQVEGNIGGPVGRAFARGCPEYSARVEFYSREEFPMMDFAKNLGCYLALPIFECGPQKKCVGVLEFLSTGSGNPYNLVNLMELKDVGLNFARPHSMRCAQVSIQVRHKLLLPLYRDVLRSVREEHQLPLIQIWMPCICDKTGNISRLFCCWTSGSHANGRYSVENGKGLVGSAYSNKKACFLGDTSQLSISDYSLVHFTRSCGFTACLAVPVQSFDLKPHDFILEVFLPVEQNWDHGNVGVMLQSLLSAITRNHAPLFHTGPIPSELEQKKEFCVQYSHSDDVNFVYFDVSQNPQTVSAGKAVGNGREEHQPSQKEDNDQNRAESFRESSAHGDAEKGEDGRSALNDNVYKRKEFDNTQSVEAGGQVILEPEIVACLNKKARENEATDVNSIPESAKGKSIAPVNDEINRGYRIVVKANYRGELAKFFFWSNSGIEVLHRELHKRFELEVEKFKINYKDDDGNWIILSCHEDLLFHLETSKTSGQTILELSVLPATF